MLLGLGGRPDAESLAVEPLRRTSSWTRVQGQLTLVEGSSVVTGVGTRFLSEVLPGADLFDRATNGFFGKQIAEVVSDTELRMRGPALASGTYSDVVTRNPSLFVDYEPTPVDAPSGMHTQSSMMLETAAVVKGNVIIGPVPDEPIESGYKYSLMVEAPFSAIAVNVRRSGPSTSVNCELIDAYLQNLTSAPTRVFSVGMLGTANEGGTPSLNYGYINVGSQTFQSPLVSFTSSRRVGIDTATPSSKLHVNGDAEASALVLKAPNGSRWRITVSNTGQLSATAL